MQEKVLYSKYIISHSMLSEMLQNLPYFWSTETQFFFILHFVLFNFPPNECPSLSTLTRAFIWGKNKVARNEKRKKLWVFVFQKYGKF